MIRIITRTTDISDAMHVGGPVHTRYNTWEIRDHAALEQHLKSQGNGMIREIIGAEIVEDR